MRGERAVGDLAVEVRGPAARDLGGAARATAVGCEAVVLNEISVAADQSLAALRATRIFPRADPAGKIAGINVTQARRLTDVGGSARVKSVLKPGFASTVAF